MHALKSFSLTFYSKPVIEAVSSNDKVIWLLVFDLMRLRPQIIKDPWMTLGFSYDDQF